LLFPLPLLLLLVVFTGSALTLLPMLPPLLLLLLVLPGTGPSGPSRSMLPARRTYPWLSAGATSTSTVICCLLLSARLAVLRASFCLPSAPSSSLTLIRPVGVEALPPNTPRTFSSPDTGLPAGRSQGGMQREQGRTGCVANMDELQARFLCGAHSTGDGV
jgi:hypothetical protein